MSHVPYRFVASLLNRPQMIEPAAAAAILSVLSPGARMDGYDGSAENEARDSREYQVVNGIAIIPVVGELVHRGRGLNPVSGLTSYQAIADALADAMGDHNVRAVMFDVDSRGGMADGCLELSERIRAWRGTKPMVAMVQGRATSAGYAVASACDRVVLTKGSHVGSIGVVACHTDLSKAYDEAGLVVTYIFAGARKIDGAPELPLTDEARAVFQKSIDQSYQWFCEVVAANRGMAVEAVKATEAAIYRAEDAVNAGLADAIATQEETLMSMTSKSAPPGARLTAQIGDGKMESKAEDKPFEPCPECQTPDECKAKGACAKGCMTPGGKDEADKKCADPAAIAEACHAAGFPGLTAGLLKVSGITMASVSARIDEAKAIALAAEKVGMKSMTGELIASGVSLETARSLMFSAKATNDEAMSTDTAHTNRNPGAKPQAKAVTLDHKAIYNRMNGIKE